MVLCVAAVTTVLFQAIRQPVVVGYLIAGMIVGPHVPVPLFADQARIHSLSELGVILLMFALGLEFSVRRLVRLGPTSGFITALQVGLMIWLGYLCGQLMGWTTLESIFTGALLSISSTTIVAKAYEENHAPGRLRELVFGVLLAEDLAAVVELAILTALASGSGLSARMVGITVGRLALFLVLLAGIGMLMVPRAIRFIARLGRSETLLVASIGICFAFAIVAEHAGYSAALGAFLAGSLVAESGEGRKVEELIVPVRDMFGAVFFVSVGMMLDPTLVAAHWTALLVLVAAVTFGKIAGVTGGAILVGSGPKLSIGAGMSLAQIGEFSFIIAALGLELHAAREFLYSLAIAVSVITTLVTPFLIRASGPVAEAFERRLPGGLGLFDSIYDSWIERMRVHAGSPAQEAGIRRSLLAIASGAASIGAIIIAAELRLVALAGWLSERAPLSFEVSEIAVAVAALLMCAVPALGVYRSSRRLAAALAARAIPQGEGEQARAGWDALVEILQVAALFLVVVVTLAIVQPFLAPIDGVIVMGLGAAAIGFVTWRSVGRMRGQMGQAARLIADALAKSPAHPEPGAAVPEQMIPGLGTLSPLRIESGSPAIGKTIGELDLHSLTGAVVVAIGRDRGGVIVPAGSEVLRDQDVLGLAGPQHAVRAAIRMLAPAGAQARGAPAPLS